MWAGRGRVFVGRDTRGSGPALEAAVVEGIVSAGGIAVCGGVLPTPAVALLAQDLGIVLSASHNPPEYNGVKFFDLRGPQALRRGGGGDRGAPRRTGARARLGRDRRGRSGRLRRAHPRALRLRPHGPADRRRLRERRLLGDRARCVRAARRAGDDRRSSAGRIEHQRRLRRDGPRAASGGRANRRVRPRGRLRRRRRPHARRRRDRRGRSTAIRSSPSSRSRRASTPSR